MAFKKSGAMFKIANSKTLNSYQEWDKFKKQATLGAETKDSEVKDSEVKDSEKKKAVDKESDLEVIAAIDTDNFVYVHSTIMAGVKNEKNGHWITAETEKFINDNNDSWTCADLMQDYKSFKTATTFVEHVQDLEKAKGKCVDVIARTLPDTILIDVLFSVDKKHADLVNNIEKGIINAVSMGCSTQKTTCSICGNDATDPSTYCQHIRSQKGQMIRCSDGKSRKAAETCKGNHFFDISLVANPAFAGAVFRKILASDQVGTELLANFISSKIDSFSTNGMTFLKAASSENEDVEIALDQDGGVDIKSGEKEIKTDDKLPEKEINGFKEILTDEKSATKFLGRIVKKFFGKDSGYHPILNSTSEDDYTISYKDYSPIPFNSRFETLDDFQRQEIEHVEMEIAEDTDIVANRVTRTEGFECYSCNYKDELWQVKASSIDNGFEDVLVCPKCGFISEKQITAKKNGKRVLSSIDRLQLKDLGYKVSDLEELAPKTVQTILQQSIKKAEIKHPSQKALEEDDYEKWQETMKKFEKGTELVAQQDIPVDNDEGVLHFDEHGASVITKNEKLTFIGTVEDGEYGLFRTETDEEFFMPMTAALKKKHT